MNDTPEINRMLRSVWGPIIAKQLQKPILLHGRPPTEEEKIKARKRHEEFVAKMDRLLTAYNNIDDPIAKLHSRRSYGGCDGCDPGLYAEGPAEWPCKTAEILIKKYLGEDYLV